MLPMSDQWPEVLLRRTADLATDYLRRLPGVHVGSHEEATVVAERLRVPLPETGEDPLAVIERLSRDVEPGLVAWG